MHLAFGNVQSRRYFKEYSYHKAPAIHTFINTKIIAESPEKLMWAGIGDALSKEYEVILRVVKKI